MSCRRHRAPPVSTDIGVPNTEASSNRFQGTPEAQWPDDAVRSAVEAAKRDQLGPEAAAKVGLRVEHGVVLLSGIVDTLLAKEASLAAAESIRGVRSVVDHVIVRVARRPDAAITLDVQRTLERRAPDRTRGLKVRVLRGVVTLTGTVGSAPAFDFAAHLAAGISGVTGVRNEAIVTGGPTRADREIIEDIRSRLRWSLPLDAHLLIVTSAYGKVILTGQVATLQDRRRAAALAWVAGVHHVSADAVAVDPSVFPREPRPHVLPGANDAAIANAIKDGIFYDPRVHPPDIGVEVQHAVATLRGDPSTLYEERAALEDANETVGVARVENLMTVRSESGTTDAELERRVTRALAADPLANLRGLSVRVADGQAMLRGEVLGRLTHARAVEIASSVPGIRSVGDGIVVVGASPSTSSRGS
jgi:osmotically-inducible protein OsmY